MTSMACLPSTARWRAGIEPEAPHPNRFEARSAPLAPGLSPADSTSCPLSIQLAPPAPKKAFIDQGAAMETRKLAFLGLGVMGFPMAGHLARAGHEVTVFNRTASRAAKWLASTTSSQKCASVPTPAAAGAGASTGLVCGGNGEAVGGGAR